MKKKLFAFVLAAAMLLTLAGCNTQLAAPSFDADMPWQSAGYERYVYKVEKKQRIRNGKVTEDGATVAVGTMTVIMNQSSDENRTTTVVTRCEITYVTEDCAIETVNGIRYDHRGLTDVITSTTTFKTGLVPVGAEKAYRLAPRPELSPGNQLYGYSYKADYDARQVTVTVGSATGDQEKSYAIPSGYYYDNEQLPYLLRALKAVTDKSSASFGLIVPYDMYLKNSSFGYTMALSTAENPVGYTLPAAMSPARFTLSNKEETLQPDSEGNYALHCIDASLSIGGGSKTPGPAIHCLFTDPAVSFAEKPSGGTVTAAPTSKLLVQTTYLEYDIGSATEKYATVLSLQDYTVFPQ